MRKVSTIKEPLSHVPVLLDAVLSYVPEKKSGRLLDVTAGGGGHFFAILHNQASKNGDSPWSGECWDRDPHAELRLKARIHAEAEAAPTAARMFRRKNFGAAPDPAERFDFILADLGVSSFQLDDPERGFSFRSESPADFRMDLDQGTDLYTWLKGKSEGDVAEILLSYGEEPRAKKLARELKGWGPETFASSRRLADAISKALGYGTPSRTHPATRAFQALRIAVNDELGELRSLLRWAPAALSPGGRLAIISFHSLEDRIVKNRFRDLAKEGNFVILTAKPVVADEAETAENPRARSALLRVLERAT